MRSTPQHLVAADLVRLKVIEGLRERGARRRLFGGEAEAQLEEQRRRGGPANLPPRPRSRKLFRMAGPDVDAAVASAIRDFEAGRLLLYVDGKNITGPHTAVVVAPMSRIRLVRVLRLSG